MDYSFYPPNALAEPFSLYGISTPDPQPSSQTHHFRNPFNDPNNYHHSDLHDLSPSFPLDPAATAFIPPAHSPEPFARSISSSDVANTNNNSSTHPASDLNDDMLADRRSSSEEKESLTPAQSRRKAQNRAAQRAFRERKERHVRELEEKVASLEHVSKTLQADNERLKQELARFATENEILRATSKAAAQSNHNDHARSPLEEPVPGPMEYSPTDFFSLIAPESGLNPPHRVTFDETTGEKLLSAAATWDLIQSHELFKRGLVDIGDVSERLKGLAQCNGQGPAFKESQVRQAIQASVAGGSDELI